MNLHPGATAAHIKNGRPERTVRVIRVSASVNRIGEPSGLVHAYVEALDGKIKGRRYDVDVKDLA